MGYKYSETLRRDRKNALMMIYLRNATPSETFCEMVNNRGIVMNDTTPANASSCLLINPLQTPSLVLIHRHYCMHLSSHILACRAPGFAGHLQTIIVAIKVNPNKGETAQVLDPAEAGTANGLVSPKRGGSGGGEEPADEED